MVHNPQVNSKQQEESTLANTVSLLGITITMHLKSFVALNALAGAAVASPAPALHPRQADLGTFIQTEKSIALQGVLNNFGSNGNLSRGAAPGVAIAGNSEINPPCMFSYFNTPRTCHGG
jgi:hypothetical protein